MAGAKLTETVTVKVSKEDLKQVSEVCEARGESLSGFFRRAVLRELRRLSFGTDFEKKALEIPTA